MVSTRPPDISGRRSDPLHQSLHALVDLDLGRPAEQVARAFDAGALEALVEAACRADGRLARQSTRRSARSRLRLTGADIDRFALTDVGRFAGQDVGADDIADPGEVARLLAVAVDGQGFASGGAGP